ncbi:MAG: hypothetical protein PHT97_13480, partial [Methanoculleus sp.]
MASHAPLLRSIALPVSPTPMAINDRRDGGSSSIVRCAGYHGPRHEDMLARKGRTQGQAGSGTNLVR